MTKSYGHCVATFWGTALKVLAAILTPTNKEHTYTNIKQACASRLDANACNFTPQQHNYECNKQANDKSAGLPDVMQKHMA